MQRKEPLEKKGAAGMDAWPAKNILTRRANQGHIFSIPQTADRPQAPCLQMPIAFKHRVSVIELDGEREKGKNPEIAWSEWQDSNLRPQRPERSELLLSC